MKEYQLWVNTLIYLGGNLHDEDVQGINTWIDLEKFVISASNFLGKESRVTRCFEHWIMLFGPLLSPSKMRKQLQALNGAFNPSLLGVIIDIIKRYDSDKKKWSIIDEFTKKNNKEELLFNHAIKSNCKNTIYKKWNIIHIDFINEESKYINYRKISKSCPELSMRIEGRSIIMADLLSFLTKTEQNLSLYQLEKAIGHNRSGIKKSFDKHIELMLKMKMEVFNELDPKRKISSDGIRK